MYIGARLRERLAQLGKTQAGVARDLGMSPRRFSHYVNDQREADYALLVRICQKMNTHPNYLFGFDDNPELDAGQASGMDRIMDELAAIKDKLAKREGN